MGFANPLLICDENNHRRMADRRLPIRAAHSGVGRREGIEQLDSLQPTGLLQNHWRCF